MIKPPGHFGRVRVLEIDDDILVSVEKPILPRVFCFVGHPAEAEFSFGVEMFPVETVEKRRRSGAIEAAIVKAQSDLGHRERISLASPGVPVRRSKAHYDVRPFTDCQVKSMHSLRSQSKRPGSRPAEGKWNAPPSPQTLSLVVTS